MEFLLFDISCYYNKCLTFQEIVFVYLTSCQQPRLFCKYNNRIHMSTNEISLLTTFFYHNCLPLQVILLYLLIFPCPAIAICYLWCLHVNCVFLCKYTIIEYICIRNKFLHLHPMCFYYNCLPLQVILLYLLIFPHPAIAVSYIRCLHVNCVFLCKYTIVEYICIRNEFLHLHPTCFYYNCLPLQVILLYLLIFPHPAIAISYLQHLHVNCVFLCKYTIIEYICIRNKFLYLHPMCFYYNCLPLQMIVLYFCASYCFAIAVCYLQLLHLYCVCKYTII